MSVTTTASPGASTAPAAKKGWLLNPTLDFWLACGGASLLLLPILVTLHFFGDRQLGFADLLLAELHLGATYDAIARRRLWQTMPRDVLVIPALILAAVYTLDWTGNRLLVFTALMYLAVWHRGRQNLGIARFYQKQAGGVLSKTHEWLFQGVIYLPMAASVLFYTTAYPTHYENEPYLALQVPIEFMWGMGALALASVLAYFLWSVGERGKSLHPGERWLVLTHAFAFGSAYFLGAWNPAFIIVLALHHELSYIYFAYAIARRQPPVPQTVAEEWRLAFSFARWPLLGLGSALICLALLAKGEPYQSWLGPGFVGLLLCHYWVDGRIWTRRAK